jgi:hypothetical protein
VHKYTKKPANRLSLADLGDFREKLQIKWACHATSPPARPLAVLGVLRDLSRERERVDTRPHPNPSPKGRGKSDSGMDYVLGICACVRVDAARYNDLR